MEQRSESDRRDSAEATTSSGQSTAAEEDGGGEAMARGLSAMLESVIKDLDSKALDTLNSQDKLSGSLDRLVQVHNKSSSKKILTLKHVRVIRTPNRRPSRANINMLKGTFFD
ncbi:hypothetical protein CARUB_v10022330mg [Capsella rubella]|uniref:Biogenesis of lysosome-related organelles complex 1 subunit 7 n=1 Tax=Capsella rubella TaxID=81985 RepID=R0IDJ1_9BRAS|nr:hypothetical protein CARUB_v10022330mg [Capsella rubella]